MKKKPEESLIVIAVVVILLIALFLLFPTPKKQDSMVYDYMAPAIPKTNLDAGEKTAITNTTSQKNESNSAENITAEGSSEPKEQQPAPSESLIEILKPEDGTTITALSNQVDFILLVKNNADKETTISVLGITNRGVVGINITNTTPANGQMSKFISRGLMRGDQFKITATSDVGSDEINLKIVYKQKPKPGCIACQAIRGT